MTSKEIIEKLQAACGDAVVEAKPDAVPEPFVKIAPAAIERVALVLRDTPDFAMDHLMCLSGMDHGKGILGVVYHCGSTVHRHRVTLKVEVPADQASVPTLSAVWPTANWHEREAYDLIGVRFEGHPDPRRILLPEDWPGHPLRKDFKVPEYYHGMKVPY